MALKGTFSSGKKFGGYTYQVAWSASQNTTNNTSTITCQHSLVCDTSYDLYIGSRTNTCTINEVEKSFTSRAISTGGGTTISLGTTTHTVKHNTDGTATFSFSAVFKLQATISGTYQESISISSKSATLDTIARASTISSAANVTLGNKCSIKWTPASTSFKYKIAFSLGTWSYTTGYIQPNTTSSYTYTGYTTPTTAIYKLLPNSTSGTMKAVLTTYNSAGTQVGSSSSKNFTVSIPTTVKPTVGTITLDPVDINSQNILVQGKNKMTISVSGCSADSSGSPIKSYTFSGPNLSTTTKTTTATSSSVSEFGPISTSGTLTYTVKVTDSRGRTASKTKTTTCYTYTNPSISGFNAYRSDSSGTSDPNGKYLKITYTKANYSSVNSTNKTTIVAYYTTGSTTKSITMTNTSKIINLGENSKTYTVYLKVTDSYGGSSTTIKKTVFGGTRVLNISKNGTGVAFGKLAERNNTLDSRWAIRSDEPAKTMNNLSLRGTNIITSPSNDTTSNWVSQGNLSTVYYNQTGQLNGQPSRYGFLLNLTNAGSMVHNIWTAFSGSLFHRSGSADGFGGWRAILDSTNYTNYVSQKPTTLYSSSSGSTGTITLSSSAANFTYLEIFYIDNNGRQPTSVKLAAPNGKYVTLTCVEPSTANAQPRVYIRSSGWTISGTTMTPGRSDLDGKNRGVYAQIYPSAGGTNIDATVTANNYIKIIRVLGYK